MRQQSFVFIRFATLTATFAAAITASIAFSADSSWARTVAFAQEAEDNGEVLFDSLKFRNIGPFRGGRSAAVAGVRGNPMLYYMAPPVVASGKRRTADRLGRTSLMVSLVVRLARLKLPLQTQTSFMSVAVKLQCAGMFRMVTACGNRLMRVRPGNKLA